MGISNVDFVKQKLTTTVNKYNKDIDAIKADLAGFKADLIGEGINSVTAAQIVMLLETSNVGNYLCYDNPSSVDMIDINNCVINTERTCGFSGDFAQDLLTVVFCAFGYESVLKDGKISYANNPDIKKSGHIYGTEDYGDKLAELNSNVDSYIGASNSENGVPPEMKIAVETAVKDNYELLNKLVEQENPTALFISGKCYLYGIGTDKDTFRALKYLERAAAAGDAEASGFLGDCYYSLSREMYISVPDRYTRAYKCYTRLGAAANRRDRQQRLVALIENKKINRFLVIASAVTYTVFVIYEVLLMIGKLCPGGCPHYVTGVISLLLSTAIMAAMIINYFIARYDSPRAQILTMAVSFCILTLIAVL